MTFAGDTVSLFDDDADLSFNELDALPESLHDHEGGKQQHSKISVPGLIEMALLPYLKAAGGWPPRLTASARLHFKVITTCGKSAVARASCTASDPIGIVAGETIAKLDLRRVGEIDDIEEESHVRLRGFHHDAAIGARMGRVGIVGECPSQRQDRGVGVNHVFRDVGRVHKASGGNEP